MPIQPRQMVYPVYPRELCWDHCYSWPTLMICQSLRSSDCQLFADDSLLYCIVNKDTESALLQRDLTTIGEWENTWQTSFNPSKCSVIRVTSGKRQKIYESNYTLHGQTLEVVDSSKYFGVTVTEDLSWTKHITETANKANRSLGFLRRNF